MKLYIGVLVKSDKPALLNAVFNMMPHRLDSRLWDSDQYVGARDTDQDGVEYVLMKLFFNDFSERASFRAALGGIGGFLHTALPGSYLKMTRCWHDQLDANGITVAPDELEYSEVVV